MSEPNDGSLPWTPAGSESASDEDFLRAAARGDQESIAHLFDRHQGSMYGLALRITNDPSLAQDVVQEAFLGVWRNAARFDGAKASGRTWMMSITHHRAIDAIRRRRPTVGLPEPEMPPPAALTMPDIWTEVSGRLDASTIQSALARLSDVQRQAIELAYFGGLTQQEIAERTNAPLGTVKSRVRLGLMALRDELGSATRAEVAELMAAQRFDCAEVDDLAGLFVLDALSEDEAAAVRDHLAACPRPHESFAAMAAGAMVLADSVERVAPPAALRGRVMSAVAAAAQVPDDLQAAVLAPVPGPVQTMPAPGRAMPEPVSIDAARQRRGPSRIGWIGLAAAAGIVIAALGAWNVSLQRQVSDAQGQVASLQQAVTTARQEAIDAQGQVASLQTRVTDAQAELTAAIDRADTSDAQVASLQGRIEDMQVQVASFQQQIAVADDRVGLIGQAIGAATTPGSNVATLISTEPGVAPAGMAIFPATGTGYIMIEGLPEIGSDQTYQAWFGTGDEMTSAGLVTAGPHGLAIVGDLDPAAGTDTIALTIEPAGGGDQPTTSPIIIGTLPAAIGSVPAV